ncbi:hypothetical protein AVEN_161611-1 [Araneus ventricosus]|uniref:Uncharacterized protein n=1 Tax=Araneus ventricosus TaxID=182803 RepID=A0A4Y2FNV0_ARAVE|nr:hypothetical protein AVEN_161611-1 [Araneus ventricosus]
MLRLLFHVVSLPDVSHFNATHCRLRLAWEQEHTVDTQQWSRCDAFPDESRFNGSLPDLLHGERQVPLPLKRILNTRCGWGRDGSFGRRNYLFQN